MVFDVRCNRSLPVSLNNLGSDLVSDSDVNPGSHDLATRPIAEADSVPLITPTYRAVALLALLFASVTSSANEMLEEMVVTGSYRPLPDTTATLSDLDAAVLTALNKRGVARALQLVPGVALEEQGGPGGLTAVSLRGGEPNFTLVLLDGVAVNDPTNTRGGGYDIGNLQLNRMERVEVLRGPRSAVYGSDALAGVINILTRLPRDGHRFALELGGGESGYRYGSVWAAGRQESVGAVRASSYTFSLASKDSGEPTPSSMREVDGINLHLRAELSTDHALHGGYRRWKGERSSYPEQSGGPRLALSDNLDRADFEDEVWSLGWEVSVAPHWGLGVTAHRFSHNEQVNSPGIEPFDAVPPNGSDTKFTRDTVQWLNTVSLNSTYSVDFGIDLRREKGRSVGFVDFGGTLMNTDFKQRRENSGIFLSVEAAPLEALLVQASVRHDDPEGFDGELTRQVGGRWHVGQKIFLRSNWGEAFKLPSFFALSHPLVGNPELNPERAQSWDVGMEWQPHASAALELTLFYNEFQDLVDLDNATFRNVNRREVDTSGAELSAHWAFSQAARLRAHGSYLNIDLKGEDTTLTARPKWQAGLALFWRATEALQGVLDYRYGGRQWSASRHLGSESLLQLDDYHRVDLSLSWRPVPHWQLHVGLDNALDANYETAIGFRAPRRLVRVGLRYES